MGCDWNEIQGFQRRILSIYAANVFPGGISLLGFRFDHSCIPNIHFQQNPALEKNTFHTIRDIAAGEELTITYTETCNLNKSQRKERLSEWDFVCTCPACANTFEALNGDKKRLGMNDLHNKIASGNTEGDWRTVRRLGQKLEAMQQAAGLVGSDLGVT